MRKEDRAKIKLLWKCVLGVMERIDKIAEGYSPEEIEADIIEAVTAARNLESQYVCNVEGENEISP